MAGKGSKPRPFEVDRTVFESNWDKIFSKKNDMWDHHCKHNGYMSIGKGEECTWCGAKEDEKVSG